MYWERVKLFYFLTWNAGMDEENRQLIIYHYSGDTENKLVKVLSAQRIFRISHYTVRLKHSNMKEA